MTIDEKLHSSLLLDQTCWIRLAGSDSLDQTCWIRLAGSDLPDQTCWIRLARSDLLDQSCWVLAVLGATFSCVRARCARASCWPVDGCVGSDQHEIRPFRRGQCGSTSVSTNRLSPIRRSSRCFSLTALSTIRSSPYHTSSSMYHAIVRTATPSANLSEVTTKTYDCSIHALEVDGRLFQVIAIAFSELHWTNAQHPSTDLRCMPLSRPASSIYILRHFVMQAAYWSIDPDHVAEFLVQVLADASSARIGATSKTDPSIPSTDDGYANESSTHYNLHR